MNLISLGNILTWCVFGLALGPVVAYAFAAYEDLIKRRKHRLSTEAKPEIAPTFISESKSIPSVPERMIVRGYDSDELFREDLWLRRLAEARRQMATLDLSTRRLKVSLKTREEHLKRLCALLAHHAGAKFDD